MRVLADGLELHQVNNVDYANFQFRHVAVNKLNGCESLEGRNIAATCHHDIGFATLVVTGPSPYADSVGAMADGLLHPQPLRCHLLASHDNVYVIAAAQTMIGN